MTKARSKKFKIFFTRTLPESTIKDLKKKYQVDIHKGPFPIPKKKLISKIKDKDGLVCFPYDTVDKEVIDAAKSLKVISAFSVGYDHINVKHAKARGIKIGYTPEVLTVATADLSITLMLDLIRRVTEGDRLIRAGGWKEVFGVDTYVGQEIPGKTLGILGLGRIGKEVAKKAQVFGMKIGYHNRHRLPEKEEKKLNVNYVRFDTLFKKSDIVSLHIPYSKETHELVNLKLLKEMKKSALIVNTARGKIINEKDLIFALKRKIIAGAALDVFEKEPIGVRHPLTKIENVVLSPHIGSSSDKTRIKMSEITVENLIRGLEGKRMLYSV